MNKFKTSIKFEAVSENESFARIVAAAFVTRMNPTLEEMSDIKTAISEAVTNSIIHGYGENGGIIEMQMWLDEYDFYVDIVDYGKGIEDIGKAMEPMYTTMEDEERSGMGFVFMEAFMDSLKVESTVGKGTSVHMMKTIKAKLSV